MITPNNLLFSFQNEFQFGTSTLRRHLYYLKVPQAWQLLDNISVPSNNKTFGDSSIIIAVNDQGVESYYPDQTAIPNVTVFPDENNLANAKCVHPDLDGYVSNGKYKFLFFYDFDSGKYSNEIFTNGGDAPHGISCSSVIGALPNTSSLVEGVHTGMVGIAPNCRLIASKLKFDPDEWAIAELIWLAGLDVKKFNPLKLLAGFNNVIPEGAHIISISYNLVSNPTTSKLLGDVLTTFGRKGFGTLAFFATGNSNTVFTSYQSALESEKLIGIGSTTYHVDLSEEVKTTGSNFSDNTVSLRGVDFCVPDLIKETASTSNADASKPLVATFTGTGDENIGGIVSNGNNSFKLKIDSINSAGDEIKIDGTIPTSINGNSVNYSGMFVLVGDYSDKSSSNRKNVKPEFNVIDIKIPGEDKFSLLFPLANTGNKKTLTIFDLGNPGVTTVLTQSIAASDNETTIQVLNNANFNTTQDITIGINNGGPFFTSKITGVGANTITIQDPIPFSFGKNTLVTVQRYATAAISTNKVQLSETYNLEYCSKLIIGDISSNNAKVVTINATPGSVNHTTKQVTLTGGGLSGIIYPQPVTGHRSVKVAVGSGPSAFTTVVELNSVIGLVEGMTVGFRLPTDPDSEARTITHVNTSTNKITLNANINDLPFETIVIVSSADHDHKFAGTSYATPASAAIAALILSVRQDLSWSEIKYIMRKTALKADFFNTDSTGRWKVSRSNSAVNAGAISNDVYSRWYGYGRLDAEAAVQETINYDPTSRDLKIRDDINDEGVIPSTYNAISSPDIWNRIKDNVADGNNAYPGGNTSHATNFMTDGPDQPIQLNVDSYIYTRINNAGPSSAITSNKNLDAWVRIYVAVTDQAPSENLFSFPESWYGEDDITTAAITSGTKVKFIGEYKLNENTIDFGSFNSLIDTNIAVNWLKWEATKKPHPETTLKTYLLTLITPFDGGNAENKVYKNNNLSYREVKFTNIQYKQGTGSLQKVFPVDTDGTPETGSFDIKLTNTDSLFDNNIEIKATITYRDATPTEAVIFKFNGSAWAFVTSPTGGWISLSSPVLSGSSAGGIQEATTFSGSLTLDNNVKDVAFETKQLDNSSNVVILEPYELDVTFNFPQPADGITEEKKTAIYTFTDFDQLPAQSTIPSAKLYGPVATALTTEYRTMSAFTGIASGTILKAYAVTNGEFFIQEVPSSNVINLILKPDNQPDNKIGLVKYFVYRGIKKSSFLQGSGEVLLNTSGLSDVLTRMWQVRTSLDIESTIPDVIKRSDIGLDETGTTTPTPGTTLVEEFFDTYVFQKLSAGWHIGDFETTGDYGFEIIVEGPNYKPTLDDIKVLDSKVTITYVGGQPTFAANQEEDIKTKLDREKILSFIDPAAYFGLLAYGKIELKKSSGNITITNDPAQVNTEILTKFGDGTSNKIYVDIRNELNNSLNFYGSYSDISTPTKVAVLKFNDTSNTLVPKEYHTSGWPILILNSTDFNASTGDFIEAKFQLPQGDNTYPGLFLSGASFFADGLSYKDKFKVLNVASSYSDAFSVSIANLGTPATVLPFVFKISYTRRYDIDNLPTMPTTLTRPWKDDYIDNLFAFNEVNITPPVADPTFQNTVVINSNSELKYIGWTSMKGADFTIRTGRVNDAVGEILFAYMQGHSEEEEKTAFTYLQSNPGLEKNQKKNISFPHSLNENFLLASNSIVSLSPSSTKIVHFFSEAGYTSIDIFERSFEQFLSLFLSATEKGTIQSTIQSNFLSNSTVYFIAFNHKLLNDSNDIPYFEFEIGLQGIEYNSTTFTYEVKQINTTIKAYSVDGKNYSTHLYATNYETLI